MLTLEAAREIMQAAVKKDGTVIGGIGTSGGSGPEDETVAENALRALGYETEF